MTVCSGINILQLPLVDTLSSVAAFRLRQMTDKVVVVNCMKMSDGLPAVVIVAATSTAAAEANTGVYDSARGSL